MRFASAVAAPLALLLLVACGAAGGTDTPTDGAAGAAAGASSAGGGAGSGGSVGVAGAGSSGGGAGGAGAGGDPAGAGGEASAGSSGAGAGAGGGAGAPAGGGPGAAGAGGSAGSSGAGGDPFGSGGAATAGSAGAAGAPGECAGLQTKPEVFGHSADTLYRLDPDTKAVTTVGPLAGCQTVIDIALDKTGKMVGTTSTGFVSIDKSTGKCTGISVGGYPNSLSFVPAGTLDPNVEALVGYSGSEYVRIDPSTGGVKSVGALSGGYSSSGDIVSVIGGGTYLTVTGPGCSDCLVEVNPKTGDKIGAPVKLGYGAVYGLAYWAGQAFGFTSGGKLFVLDLVTKATTEVNIPNKPSGLSFYGAGSTTCAVRGKE